ncbi:phosphoribosylformylglycinamidine synthase subunit PurS [Stomatohabitans albus]|uniref:phosphoribosylformylglycinamidine synthase subunit PurS n=1 Tax=Stomatohabitans albus TaxID=3110766 RepID=UPI00300DA084
MPKVNVNVMLKREILDPAGQAVERNLPKMGLDGVNTVRIGKRIELDIDDSVADPVALATKVASQLLANEVLETFEVEH